MIKAYILGKKKFVLNNKFRSSEAKANKKKQTEYYQIYRQLIYKIAKIQSRIFLIYPLYKFKYLQISEK